jgi:hypothetical protein
MPATPTTPSAQHKLQLRKPYAPAMAARAASVVRGDDEGSVPGTLPLHDSLTF